MNDIYMTFDELLTMKALEFKSSLSGRGNNSFVAHMVERDEAQAIEEDNLSRAPCRCVPPARSAAR